MCLRIIESFKSIKQFKKDNLKITEKNIRCYKVLIVYEYLEKSKYYASPYYYTIWEKNKIKKNTIKINNVIALNFYYYDSVIIDEGLHSYKNYDKANILAYSFNNEKKVQIFEMTIPKGAKYVEHNGHYVSNQLYFGRIKN
jgi:hypothetical protein